MSGVGGADDPSRVGETGGLPPAVGKTENKEPCKVSETAKPPLETLKQHYKEKPDKSDKSFTKWLKANKLYDEYITGVTSAEMGEGVKSVHEAIGGHPQLAGVDKGASWGAHEIAYNYRENPEFRAHDGSKERTPIPADDSAHMDHSLSHDNFITGKKSPVTLKKEELVEKFKAENGGRDPDWREMQDIKVRAQHLVYQSLMKGQVEKRICNPAAMATEMRVRLGVSTGVPKGINSDTKAKKALGEELDRYVWSDRAEARDYETLDPKLAPDVKEWVNETYDLYREVYPEMGTEAAFIFIREMVRALAYQQIFDQKDLSGSDHGWMHATHNIHNSHSMVDAVEGHAHHHHGEKEAKAPARLRLALNIAHAYHDIGYSIPDPHFAWTKDHPFVGAAFIDEQRAFFDHYLDPQGTNRMTNDIRDVILTHSIVQSQFNGLDTILEKKEMTRAEFKGVLSALMTTSDGCAAGRSDKMQRIWRENPDAVLEMHNVLSFVEAMPMYKGKFMSPKAITHPEEVFKLKDPKRTEGLFDEDNFVDPGEYLAYKVLHSSVDSIKAIVKENVPAHLQADYESAIDNKFNFIGTSIALKQFGMELVGVTLVPAEPGARDASGREVKWIPKVQVALTKTAKATNASNAVKVGADEFAIDEKEIMKVLESGEAKEFRNANVVYEFVSELPPVRDEEVRQKMEKAEAEIEGRDSAAFPRDARMQVHSIIDSMKDMKKAAEKLQGELKESDRLKYEEQLKTGFERVALGSVLLGQKCEHRGEKEAVTKTLHEMNEVAKLLLAREPIDPKRFDAALFRFCAAASTAEEWEVKGLQKPEIS